MEKRHYVKIISTLHGRQVISLHIKGLQILIYLPLKHTFLALLKELYMYVSKLIKDDIIKALFIQQIKLCCYCELS